MAKSVLSNYLKDNLRYVTDKSGVEISRKDLSSCIIDISIHERLKDRIADDFQSINEFSIEVGFRPPPNTFIEIVGTDRLLERGYSLLHNKIVEPNDDKPVRVYLFKFGDKEDLVLPFHKALIGVLRPCNYAHIKRELNKKDSSIGSVNTQAAFVQYSSRTDTPVYSGNSTQQSYFC